MWTRRETYWGLFSQEKLGLAGRKVSAMQTLHTVPKVCKVNKTLAVNHFWSARRAVTKAECKRARHSSTSHYRDYRHLPSSLSLTINVPNTDALWIGSGGPLCPSGRNFNSTRALPLLTSDLQSDSLSPHCSRFYVAS